MVQSLILVGRRSLSSAAVRSGLSRCLVAERPSRSLLSSTAPRLSSAHAIRTAVAATDGSGGRSSTRDGPSVAAAFGMLAAASAVTVRHVMDTDDGRAECSGIAGVVGGSKTDSRDFLLDALNVLKIKGYDSAGMATHSGMAGESVVMTKFACHDDKADGIDLVSTNSQNSAGHHIGIAHTRWATHGGKTDENAHPHSDSSGKIALVHNGYINNGNELRKELQGFGHEFTSQTDTEVVAKLIGHYYAPGAMSVKDATELALARCEGTWGLVVMCTDTPDELVVACNGSPLMIGLSSDRTYVTSDKAAFDRHTKHFISMKDGEIGVLHADGRMLDVSRKELANVEDIQISPDPYPHWTIKECLEQPESLARALGFGGRLTFDRILLGGLDSNLEAMSKIRFMTLSACGTSLNAALYAERLMKQLGSFESVQTLDSSETEAKDFPRSVDPKKSALIVVSQSGETKEVHEVLKTAMDMDMPVISVVNAVGSLIAQTTKLGVYCHAGRENAVASTKAFTSEVTALALIALWFRQTKDKLSGLSGPSKAAAQLQEALMRLPITFGMAAKSREHCKKIAATLKNKEHCFVLGKGFGEPVAMEGALKLKEMAYLHAEGYSGGALKHGPFALIDGPNGKFGPTPIIMLIFDDHHAHHMRTAAEEVKARGAEVIIITDNRKLAEGLDEDPIVIPQNGPLTALGAVLPLQLLAYELAVLKGINPDYPRNLQKTFSY